MLKEIKKDRTKKKIIDYLSTLKVVDNINYSYLTDNTSKSIVYLEHRPRKWIHIYPKFITNCGILYDITPEIKKLIEDTIINYYKLRYYEFTEWNGEKIKIS